MILSLLSLQGILLVSCEDDEATSQFNFWTDYDSEVVEAVDLALPSGTLWANCNVGANKPEDYGCYFAWGETTFKSKYDWATYKWSNGSYSSITKYNTLEYYGATDDLTELEANDDAASVLWSNEWQIPTYTQFEELIDFCDWEWKQLKDDENNDIKDIYGNKIFGYVVTGTNGNFIFLPAAGYGYDTSRWNLGTLGEYWTSTLNTERPNGSYFLQFNSSDIKFEDHNRCNGRSIRAVHP